jgi:septation ring formation regulator EzrA
LVDDGAGRYRRRMEKVSEGLREAMDRYYRVQELAFRRRGPKGPGDPGFKPMREDELAALEALEALVTAIEELRRAQEAWVDAGRPELH